MYGQTINRRTPSPGSQRIQNYSPASSRGGNSALLNITQSSQSAQTRNRLLDLGNQLDGAGGTGVRASQQQQTSLEGVGVRDRTQEFFATVESMLSRSHDSPVDTQRLLKNAPMKKSQFAQEAAQIGKEINRTTVKLGELAKLAKRKGLFDDKSEEINQLMFVIKQDIAKVNQRIAGLSNALAQMKRGATQLSGKQAEDHAQHVVMSLQSKLATTSSQFKDILELRTQNLKESKQRKDQYGVAVPTPVQAGNGSPFSTSGLPPPDSSSTPVPLNFGQNGGFQSQELMQANTSHDYVSSRAQAIESIESTIAELGQVCSFGGFRTNVVDLFQLYDHSGGTEGNGATH